MAIEAKSLTNRLMLISLSTAIGLSFVFLLSNYVLTSQALDREIKRSHEYRANLAKIALNRRLNILSETLNAITQQIEKKEGNPQDEILKYLETLTLSDEGLYIDILALVSPEGDIKHNLSSPIVKKAEALIHRFNESYIPNGWHLVLIDDEQGLQAALMGGISLVEPEFGKVYGLLYYGIGLNDNTPLINDLKTRAELEGLELRINDSKIAIASTNDNIINSPLQKTYVSFSNDSDSLVFYTHIKDQLSKDIDKAYITNAAFILSISIFAVFFMIVLIKRIISRSVDNLADYAQAIEKSQAYQPFVSGHILEFNQLGSTIEGLVKSLQDSRTILENKEENIRQIINSTAEAIYGLDDQGVCTFANKACVEKLGYQNDTELVGKVLHDVMHCKHSDGSPYPIFECPVYQSLATGEHVHNDSEVMWRADGTYFPAEYWSHPIMEEGKVSGSVVTFFDISEKKKTEDSLRRAQKMEAVGQLTGGIAHDFNNIMGIILGNINLIKRESQPDTKLDAIENAARRATDLTRQLLDFSREKNVEAKVTNVNRIVGEMKELISRSLTPEIELELYLSDAPLLASIDAGQLSDAILNLSINARDAMPNGGKLTIETSECYLDDFYCAHNPSCTPGNYVQVIVSDTGEGISAEDQERIFDPFYTTKPQGKGTGLGLAMVFGFAKRSNGHIKPYSEPGLGATFRLYLPQSYDQEETSENTIVKDLPRGKEIILLVDDEPELLSATQQQLANLGYEILCARDGASALEQLRQNPGVDLLFSDVVMPGGINGFQLAETALAINPALKVLLTSGYTGKAIRNKEQSLFSTKLLAKPYSLNDLAVAIRQQLDNEECLSPTIKEQELSGPKIGLDLFDNEHKEIKLFLERSQALEETKNVEAQNQLLCEIEDYINAHLPLEEAIMEACQYPGFQNHKNVHQLLEKQFLKLKSRLASQPTKLNMLSTFLSDWWLDHILTMDVTAIKHCKRFPDVVSDVVDSYRNEK